MEQPSSGTARNRSFDVLRGIGIFLSVFGHCISYGSGAEYKATSAYIVNPVYNFIYMFHMPLLALVSGMTLYYSLNRHAPKEVLIRKVEYIGIPYLSWGIPTGAILYLFFPVLAEARGIFSKIDILAYTFNSYWFLRGVLFLSILTIFIHWAFKDHPLGFIAFAVLILALFPQEFLSRQIVVYFFLGYLLNKYIVEHKIEFPRKTAACYITLAVCVVIFTAQYLLFNSNRPYLLRLFDNPDFFGSLLFAICRFAAAMAACLFLYIVVNFILERFPNSLKLTSAIGKETFGIYIVSSYFLDFVLVYLTKSLNHNIIINLAEAFVITGLCYVITLLGKKIPVIRFFLFGVRPKKKTSLNYHG